MDLIEIIDNYRDILKRNSLAEGQNFLDGIGVHPVIQGAIIACFHNNGLRKHLWPDPEAKGENENGI